MSQLIVPGGRPAPKKEEPTGPVVLSWAVIVTVSDMGIVSVNHYDSDFEPVHCQRKATPEDVIGACAYIEHMGPAGVDSLTDFSDSEEIFKTAFVLGSAPNGHPIIHDDLFAPLVVTYPPTGAQVFMAAATIKVRVGATMTAELTAPGAGQTAAQTTIDILQQFEARRALGG